MLLVLLFCFDEILEQACNKATLSPASKQDQAQLETAARSGLTAGSLSLQAIKPMLHCRQLCKATPTCMHASANYRIQSPTLCFLYLHALGRTKVRVFTPPQELHVRIELNAFLPALIV